MAHRIDNEKRNWLGFLIDFFFKLFSEFYLQKLTMMRIPDKGICYLMPLPKELSAPDKLIGDLEKASQVRKSGFLQVYLLLFSLFY